METIWKVAGPVCRAWHMHMRVLFTYMLCAHQNGHDACQINFSLLKELAINSPFSFVQNVFKSFHSEFKYYIHNKVFLKLCALKENIS